MKLFYFLRGVFLAFLLGVVSVQVARAQEVFSSGDEGSDESVPSNDGGPSDDYYNGGGGHRYRPLPGYTDCGPWYYSYQNFVRAMMKHYGGFCEVRNGNQVWCHARKPGNCNPDATGGRPDSPIMDTGVRYTPKCQSVCDRTVAEGGNYEPVRRSPEGSNYNPARRRPEGGNFDPVRMNPTPEPPPPCDMPSLEQLSLPPDDGDVAVAYALPPEGGDVAVAEALPPEGGDVAVAEMLPPEGGDVAVALALPASVTLTGQATKNGEFTSPQTLTLHGKATKGGGTSPSQQPLKLQGFAIKSLRIPVTYKPPHPKSTGVSPAMQQQETVVWRGSAGTYDPEVGKQRFLAGFLEGMQAELKQLNRYGHERADEARKKRAEAEEKKTGKKCEIKGTASPIFGNLNVVKHPTEAGKFVMDMIDKTIKSDQVQKLFPRIKMIPIIGPLVAGADFISSYKDTLDDFLARDTRIRDAMANSPGHDLDPRDVGYIAGQDAADAYQFFVKSTFALAP